MSGRYSLESIRHFWADQAVEHGQSPSASWSDIMVIEMEIRQISKYLTDGDHVLDVGCANGYSTVRFANLRQIRIRGIDFVPEMIEQARFRLEKLIDSGSRGVEFEVCNVTNLTEPSGSYDKVICIRVIINMGDWDHQIKAINECARVLKPGGLLLLSEATVQGWQNMNEFRREWQLPDIPIPPFNLYIDQDQLINAVSRSLQLVELINFSSTYYVGTRILKPILAQALGTNIDVANPLMHWNQWFADLPAWGDYGTQKLFVFKKN